MNDFYRNPFRAGKHNRAAVAALIILGGLIYLNSLSNFFVWDDELLVTGNNSIRSLRGIPRIFTRELAPRIGGNFYRPLQSISYALDYFFWGYNPFGYHLTNLIIHLANSVLLYFILLTLTRRRVLSFLAAMLFVAHPVQTEAVTYISGRADILAALFMLSSVFCFLISRNKYVVQGFSPANRVGSPEGLHYDRNRNSACRIKTGGLFIASVFCFILALLTKEAAVILPLLVLLCDFSFRKRADAVPRQKLKFFAACGIPGGRIAYYGAMFLIAAAYLAVRASLQISGGGSISSNPYNFPARFFTSFKVILLYLKLLLLPFPLRMERVITIGTSLFAPAVILPLLFLGGVLIAATRVCRSAKIAFFGIAWFFLALLPYLNWFPLNAEMAEHWLYLPSVGFFLVFALLVETSKVVAAAFPGRDPAEGESHRDRGRLPKSGDLKVAATLTPKILTYLLFATILACFSALTIDRNRDWRDNETIYTQTALNSPQSPRAHYNLGNLYLNRGEFEKAHEELRLAIGIKPWDFMSRKSLGKALLGLGELPGAIKEFEAAVSLKPSNAGAHNELGVAYGMAGLNPKALRELKIAIKLDPESAQTRSNLASVYTNLGEFQKALVECERALELNPGLVEANFNLGVIYYHLERIEEARKQFERVLKLNPGFGRARIWRERLKTTSNEK